MHTINKHIITSLIILVIGCTSTEKRYFNDGNLKSVHKVDRNGDWNGLITEYYKSGQLKFEGYYLHGSPDGIAKYYHSNGSIKMIKPFKKGLVHGMVKGYDSLGHNILLKKFDIGQLQNYIRYDTNGRMTNGMQILDTNDLPDLKDFSIKFSHRPDTFMVGDTTSIDIRYDSIFKYQIMPRFTNGFTIYKWDKDSFIYKFSAKREGKAHMMLDLKINDSITRRIGNIKYPVIGNKN